MDLRERARSFCRVEGSDREGGVPLTPSESPSGSAGIGLLNEKPLHAALKAWYALPDDIHEVSVNIIDSTAILLNRITLLAVVGGNEVTNPFMVTEVYVQKAGSWSLVSLSFTKLLTP